MAKLYGLGNVIVSEIATRLMVWCIRCPQQ